MCYIPGKQPGGVREQNSSRQSLKTLKPEAFVMAFLHLGKVGRVFKKEDEVVALCQKAAQARLLSLNNIK